MNVKFSKNLLTLLDRYVYHFLKFESRALAEQYFSFFFQEICMKLVWSYQNFGDFLKKV